MSRVFPGLWEAEVYSPTLSPLLRLCPFSISKLRQMVKGLELRLWGRAAICSSTTQRYSLLVKKQQITATLRYCLIPSISWAKIQKCDDTLCWPGCGESGNPTHCWGSICSAARWKASCHGNYECTYPLIQHPNPGTPEYFHVYKMTGAGTDEWIN